MAFYSIQGIPELFGDNERQTTGLHGIEIRYRFRWIVFRAKA